MKILVMGLPRSGKSTLATKLAERLMLPILNGDAVREKFNDFDFSAGGRIRQAERMKSLARDIYRDDVVLDFVCPTRDARRIVDPDFIILVDVKTNECPYEDTKAMFEYPYREEYDVRVLSWDDSWVDLILEKIEKLYKSYEYSN